MNDNALAKLDAARMALAECKTVMEAKQISDIAEAARIYLERTNASAETVNRATEIRLLAERQMGEFLKVMPKNKGAMGKGASVVNAPDSTTTLAELGIKRQSAADAQKLADIPKAVFEERINNAKDAGEKLTRATVTKSRRPHHVWSRSIWERQTRGIMTSWLESVPEDDRIWAAKYLSDLLTKILHNIQK